MRSIILSLFMLTLVSACAVPEITAKRVGYSKEEHQIWEDAAKAGNLDAQFELGWSYCCGERGLFDNRQAMKWMCSAAKQEHREAQFTVASLYDGTSYHLPFTEADVKKLPENNALALAWYIVSKDNGHKDAPKRRDMFKRLSFEEVVEAIDLSRQYPDMPCEIED